MTHLLKFHLALYLLSFFLSSFFLPPRGFVFLAIYPKVMGKLSCYCTHMEYLWPPSTTYQNYVIRPFLTFVQKIQILGLWYAFSSMGETAKLIFCFESSLTKQQNGLELPFPIFMILQFLNQWKNGIMVSVSRFPVLQFCELIEKWQNGFEPFSSFAVLW